MKALSNCAIKELKSEWNAVFTGWQSNTEFREHKESFNDVGCRMFSIPATFPDINRIKNMFNIVCKSLKEDAVNQCIEHETYKEFSRQVKKTLLTIQ